MDPILFAGGDRRTLAALDYIQKQGYRTETYALPHRVILNGKAFSALILPFPCIKQGKLNAPLTANPPTLAELIAETGIDPHTVPVIGGPLAENPFRCYRDLSQSEELKMRNAVTTAEGALALLIQNTQKSVFGMSVLIVGYGAIGKRLASMLRALGARVTVAARKEKDRVAASLEGCGVQDTENLQLGGMDAVVNTVPHRLLDRPVQEQNTNGLFFLELASPPYGLDPDLSQTLGEKYRLGAALPGKVSPLTAGEDLAKTILSLLPSPKTKGSGI